MSRQGILSPSVEPSQWASRSFVLPKKDGERVRLVADYRTLNKALIRPVWPTESLDQLMRTLNPTHQIFAVLDCTSAYHQIELDEESKKLTTLVTIASRYHTFWQQDKSHFQINLHTRRDLLIAKEVFEFSDSCDVL